MFCYVVLCYVMLCSVLFCSEMLGVSYVLCYVALLRCIADLKTRGNQKLAFCPNRMLVFTKNV